jgi:hypothetical protein
MGEPFIFQSVSRFRCRGRRHGLLKEQDVKDGQNADRVENGQADKPRQLVVPRALPHGDQLPVAIPDCQEDDH